MPMKHHKWVNYFWQNSLWLSTPIAIYIAHAGMCDKELRTRERERKNTNGWQRAFLWLIKLGINIDYRAIRLRISVVVEIMCIYVSTLWSILNINTDHLESQNKAIERKKKTNIVQQFVQCSTAIIRLYFIFD